MLNSPASPGVSSPIATPVTMAARLAEASPARSKAGEPPNILIRVIRKTPPNPGPDVLSPELQKIADDESRWREQAKKREEEERTGFLNQPWRAPFEQEFARYPLDYPKQGF